MSLSIVIKHAEARGLRIRRVDERTLYIDSRPCQVIPSVWFHSFSEKNWCMSMYLPRTTFADFLLYVPRGTDDVYIIPRGLLSYDTGWARDSLQPYLHAWKLLRETSPGLFERKFLPINAQLQRVIDIAKYLELDFELIYTKKGAKRTPVSVVLATANYYSWETLRNLHGQLDAYNSRTPLADCEISAVSLELRRSAYLSDSR